MSFEGNQRGASGVNDLARLRIIEDGAQLEVAGIGEEFSYPMMCVGLAQWGRI
jgi:hypothetical protein